MTRRGVPIIPAKKLEVLSTKQLLARLQRLRECEEKPGVSDLTAEEIAATNSILFKQTAQWQDAYRELKQILANREHVPGGKERAQRRLETALRQKTSEHRHGR